MNSNKNLVFLGMMGSGKSSIGAMVSKKLNIPFIDIDNLIEEHAGMTVSEIFEVNGEDYFRNLEEKITIKSLNHKNVVVSRTPCAHGPWAWEPPRGGAQAPGAPFREFARNRREKVCNSAVLGV